MPMVAAQPCCFLVGALLWKSQVAKLSLQFRIHYASDHPSNTDPPSDWPATTLTNSGHFLGLRQG